MQDVMIYMIRVRHRINSVLILLRLRAQSVFIFDDGPVVNHLPSPSGVLVQSPFARL